MTVENKKNLYIFTDMTKQKDFILNVFCFVKQNIQNESCKHRKQSDSCLLYLVVISNRVIKAG